MNEITCFSTHDFELKYLKKYNLNYNFKINYIDERLEQKTAHYAKNSKAILCWASDNLNKVVLSSLASYGCKMISLRSAGYSHLDITTAKSLGITVSRVPSYSPESIAEHAVALYLCLNRKIPRAHQRVKNFNFSLEGLEGWQVSGKKVGIIGAGLIGQAFLRIMLGFGAEVLIFDPNESERLSETPNVSYSDLDTVLKESDLISLHCPLNKETKHLLNYEKLSLLKKDAFLINTGRGSLIKTTDLLQILKEGKIGGVGLDVYEFEEDIFSYDLSETGIDDDELVRIMSFPNVIVTSHQAFFTKEALENIEKTSLENIHNYFASNQIKKENILI